MIEKFWKGFVFFLPLLIGGILYYILRTNTPLYELIGMEDGPLEWIQFSLFLISTVLAILLAIKCKKNVFLFSIYILFALALLFISLEEISWGERIFNGINTELAPVSIMERNIQGELNIHNIDAIHSKIGYVYILVGFVGCFSWLLVYISKKIFSLNKSVLKILEQVVPSFIFFFYFFPLFINLITNYGFRPQDYEVVEFVLSIGIFLYLVEGYRKRALDLKAV
ncbi:MAG: hypothetical protein UR61_C0029G0009 [candidate division WS6 bacterium GW2011_GWE1_34_7]|uniref:Uncharacterized protein n=2 Tax=Candidatus Dojkabacteria TaxID=74243 RepID=A0A0G0BNK7_9BACT|nr:MAG: hypothetical protein UR61_C0029G0009 [candidate division WS6 bacterium GW2011_GWE1_34_7]KKP78090.1 MAG: hypothetical protein UR73_C0004G0011 [candidate division WS6 bacterium GW2011_GWF1_35_23]